MTLEQFKEIGIVNHILKVTRTPRIWISINVIGRARALYQNMYLDKKIHWTHRVFQN